jgi:VanZ family protein/nitroreductase
MKMTVAHAPHLRRAGLLITIASLVAIALATLTPEPPGPTLSHFCLVCGSFGTVDAILNIVLFVPLGIGLALSGVPGKRALLAMCVLSTLIETAQFLVIPGRDSTLGDILTNTLGGALGFVTGRYPRVWLRPPPRIARTLAVAWAILWLTVQIVSNFGFTLSIPRSTYYGQIARTLGNFAVFPGHVVSTSIDDLQLPNVVVADSRRLRQMLLDGGIITATVTPAKPARGIAPILRVADAQQREILLLAQDGDNLVFGVHTGAAVLRLRSPLFALAGAFPAEGSNLPTVSKSLTVSGRYRAGEVRMDAQSAAGNRDSRIVLTASLGWTQWLPFQWFIEGTLGERVVSWLWIACLVFPLGYWAAWARDFSRSQRSRRQMALAPLLGAAIVFAALILIPHALGLPSVPIGDWVATFGGFLIGVGLGGRTAALRVANGGY